MQLMPEDNKENAVLLGMVEDKLMVGMPLASAGFNGEEGWEQTWGGGVEVDLQGAILPS